MKEPETDPGCDVCQTLPKFDKGDCYIEIDLPNGIIHLCSWPCVSEFASRQSRATFVRLTERITELETPPEPDIDLHSDE